MLAPWVIFYSLYSLDISFVFELSLELNDSFLLLQSTDHSMDSHHYCVNHEEKLLIKHVGLALVTQSTTVLPLLV